jgi:hypothetical protein
MRRLPIVQIQDQSHQLFEDRNGHPVWSVAEPAEAHALARLSETLGASVAALSPSDVVAARPRTGGANPGSVFIYGAAELDPLGRLYAHLTGRAFGGRCKTVEDLDRTRSNLVLLLYADLSLALAESASAKQSQHAVGLICADDPPALHREVLLKSAALYLAKGREARVLDMGANLSSRVPAGVPVERINQSSQRGAARQALRQGRDIVAIQTHSDGVDISLPPDLILCGMDRPDEQPGDSKKPSCLITGQCYRRHIPVSDVPNAPWFISSEELTAGVMLLDTCWGYLPDGAQVDSRWGYLRHLLNRSVTGAIITSWQIMFNDATTSEFLVESLRTGMPLGKAVRRHDLTARAYGLGRAFFIFGDPDLHFKRVSRRRTGRLAALTSGRARALLSASAFLRACILDPPCRLKPSEEGLLDAALAALNRFETVARSPFLGLPKLKTALVDVQQCAIDLFFAYRLPNIDHFWSRFARAYRRTKRDVRCSTCQSRAVRVTAQPMTPASRKRQVTICPRCGVVEDAPFGADLSLRVKKGGTLQLEGVVPNGAWLGAVRILARSGRSTPILPWPKDGQGAAVRIVHLPMQIPLEPSQVLAIFFNELEVTALSSWIHGQAVAL